MYKAVVQATLSLDVASRTPARSRMGSHQVTCMITFFVCVSPHLLSSKSNEDEPLTAPDQYTLDICIER